MLFSLSISVSLLLRFLPPPFHSWYHNYTNKCHSFNESLIFHKKNVSHNLITSGTDLQHDSFLVSNEQGCIQWPLVAKRLDFLKKCSRIYLNMVLLLDFAGPEAWLAEPGPEDGLAGPEA